MSAVTNYAFALGLVITMLSVVEKCSLESSVIDLRFVNGRIESTKS